MNSSVSPTYGRKVGSHPRDGGDVRRLAVTQRFGARGVWSARSLQGTWS